MSAYLGLDWPSERTEDGTACDSLQREIVKVPHETDEHQGAVVDDGHAEEGSPQPGADPPPQEPSPRPLLDNGTMKPLYCSRNSRPFSVVKNLPL